MTPMYGVNKVGEEGFDLECAHGGGVTQFVEADKTHVPVEIGFLGADGVPAQADSFAQAIGEFLFRHGRLFLDSVYIILYH